MTTVRLPIDHLPELVGVVRKMLLAVFAGLWLPCLAAGQSKPVHRLYHPALPPGAIGSGRLVASGPLSGYIQPVEIRGPQGTKVSIGQHGSEATQEVPLLVGMHVGPVYRLRVTNLPNQPGVEVYPTLEIIDRVYPPAGRILEHPIPIELREDDLLMAVKGLFITRVIYVEDPQQAVPITGDPRRQSWFDAPAGEDPLTTAAQMGRPVAILRIGSRIPNLDGSDGSFDTAPPVTHFERRTPDGS